jgi:anthranilate 1,2-dioxygenase small subunit
MNPVHVHAAATELMHEYAERIDSDRLEEWIELFTDDAQYRVIPRENVEQNLPAPIILSTSKNMLRDRIVSLRSANEFNLHYDRHIVGPPRVRAQGGNLWSVEANYAVFQTTMEGVSKLFSVGRYIDKVRFEGESLLFSDKLVIVDSFSIPTLLATPL